MAENTDTATVVLQEQDGKQYIRHSFQESKDGNPTKLTGYGFAGLNLEKMSIEDITAHFDKLAKQQNRDVAGVDILKSLAQSAYDSMLRVKVKNSLKFPNDQEETAYLTKVGNTEHKLVFGVDQAETWLPGTRELGGMNLIKQLLKQFKDLTTGENALPMSDPKVMAIMMQVASKTK